MTRTIRISSSSLVSCMHSACVQGESSALAGWLHVCFWSDVGVRNPSSPLPLERQWLGKLLPSTLFHWYNGNFTNVESLVDILCSSPVRAPHWCKELGWNGTHVLRGSSLHNSPCKLKLCWLLYSNGYVFDVHWCTVSLQPDKEICSIH